MQNRNMKYLQQIKSIVFDLKYYKLTRIQKIALFKKCCACGIGYLHAVPSSSGTSFIDSDELDEEVYLWCNNCDLSMDSSGGYTD